GTVEPEETVDVGAQVVGRIKELGKDPRGLASQNVAAVQVDYEKPVTADQAPVKDATTPAATDAADAEPTEKITPPAKYRKQKLGTDSIGQRKSAPYDATA